MPSLPCHLFTFYREVPKQSRDNWCGYVDESVGCLRVGLSLVSRLND